MDNNYIKVRVEGKNVNNYIKWLIIQKINIINLKVLKHNILELIIEYKDLNKLKKYSKTYNITTIKKYGYLKMFEMIKKNSFILISLIMATMFLYFLSNIIFSIDIVYNNQEIIKMIDKELKKHGIEKYKFKKKYEYLEKVKEQILKDNSDTLEWIEIVEDGTKYIIKLVERKQKKDNIEYEYQSITANKDAIITSIKAETGEKAKEINDYVKTNEVIVSGVLSKPDGTTIYKKAKGIVYGEVWYKVDIEYPYAYKEEKLTGKSKKFFVINFLNHKIPLFAYQKYKEFRIETNNIIVESNILPISLSKEKYYEVITKEEIYTWEEAVSNATEIAKNKLLESNNKIINIKKVEILDKRTNDSKIKLNLFISVIEDITKISEIKQIEERNLENDLQS